MNPASASLNLWSVVFIAGVAQGLFLLVLFVAAGWKNVKATVLLGIILFLAVVTDLDYLFVSSGLYAVFPYLFGISFGFMYLFGPLLYWYTRSILSREFAFTPSLLWHLIPFALYKLYLIPLLFLPNPVKISFIDAFVGGTLPLRPVELTIFITQAVHMSVYLIITMRLIFTTNAEKASLLIPLESRRWWLKVLLGCFGFFLVSIVALLVYVTATGVYSTTANYLFASVLSATIFIISYIFVLRRDVVAPDHAGKYSSAGLADELKAEYSAKLKLMMEQEQAYLDPELSLSVLALRMEITPHILSRIINEEHNRNFFDFINTYRIKEVQRRLTDPQFQSLSILGIAMECGFNTKSSFNTAFKKMTGMTPSEYKSKGEPTPDRL